MLLPIHFFLQNIAPFKFHNNKDYYFYITYFITYIPTDLKDAHRKKSPKEMEKSAVKKAVKNLHDNEYYANFLNTLQIDTGKKVRFTDEKKDAFLKTMVECHGFPSIAANKMGFYYGSVQYAMKNDPQFAQAVDVLRKSFNQERLDGLEKLSYEQASEAKNTAERIFQLKSLDPHKYRDRMHNTNTQVNVMVAGITPKDRSKMIKDMK
tara:strand:+ start:73 stop:696 length:624 start_codon:yes stop_codon:yes gene_type:complete